MALVVLVAVVVAYLYICLSASLKTKLSCETSWVFELLRDFLNFRSWQHQNRNNSARLASKMESWEPSWRSRANAFCDFPLHLSKVPRLRRKLMPDHTKCCTCHAKSSSQHWRSYAPLRKSAPWPPNISDEHVSCTAPATENASLQILFICPTPAVVVGNGTKPSRFAHFWQGAQSLAPATRNNILTSKSGPYMVCLVHFDFEMCFAPQRRALFRHLNFQKWSGAEVFCAFWLANVLRTTTACTFSTSQLPKVVREWCALHILTSKCASRHNGVQFFISHLARWLCTRRFSEPSFRPSGATNHWKNTVFRDFPTFSRICIFFLLTSDSFSSIIFSLLLFSSLCLFPPLLFICPYCRKFDF